jgi:class 3 adenylate cyclase
MASHTSNVQDAEGVDPDNKEKDRLLRNRKRASITLHDIFPPSIAEKLERGDAIEPEHFDMVTVFFCDVVGFTTLSSQLCPGKVADMLDRLYEKFDILTVSVLES